MNTRHEEIDPEESRLEALLATVRSDRPDTSRVEYGFETRLSARLAVPDAGILTWWAAWTWRLAPLFAVIALSLALWTQYAPSPVSDDKTMTELSSSAEDDLGSWLLNDDSPFS